VCLRSQGWEDRIGAIFHVAPRAPRQIPLHQGQAALFRVRFDIRDFMFAAIVHKVQIYGIAWLHLFTIRLADKAALDKYGYGKQSMPPFRSLIDR